MHRIYADNAATSYPKPPCVAQAMMRYINDIGCNVNRGTYKEAQSAELTVLETREKLAQMFCAKSAKSIIFTSGATMSINMLLRGILVPGDHVVTTQAEHNAVLRTLQALTKQGVTVDIIKCDENGVVDMAQYEAALGKNTKLCVFNHASNVCGTVQNIRLAASLAHKANAYFVVDAAQTAGIIPVTLDIADAIAFAGHKGLFGAAGIGGFAVTEHLGNELTPTITGGTGSFSHLSEMPQRLPDKLEAGTLNIPGIYGLNAALCFVQDNFDEIVQKEKALTNSFLQGLGQIKNIYVPSANITERTSVVSVDFIKKDNANIAYKLEEEYGIITRCGLHCAPLMHRAIGTYPQGSVRFSFSYFNTQEEINNILGAINAVV